MSQWSYSPTETPITEKITQSNTPVIISDTRNHDLWVEVPKMRWVRSFMAMPIRVRDELVGAINLHSSEPHHFLPEHGLPLQAFANQAAVAIEHARLFEALHTSEARLRALTQRVTAVRETERTHLARELHDGVGQQLTALQYSLELLQQNGTDASTLENARTSVSAALDGIRTLIFDLRPVTLDRYGLAPAIRQLVETLPGLDGLRIKLDLDEVERLSPEVETALYRIVQESLNNVVRHSNARAVVVELRRTEGGLRMCVGDDGVGFEHDALRLDQNTTRGLGVLGMQERAELLDGQLDIVSHPGAGTNVKIEIPVVG